MLESSVIYGILKTKDEFGLEYVFRKLLTQGWM